MMRFPRSGRGTLRLFILGVVAATATASVASSLTASAAVTTCTGVGAVSGAPDINYGTCATDQEDGDGSVAFSSDGNTATLSAKTKRGDEQVAGFWGTNGPVSGAVTRICIGLNVTELKVKKGGAVEEQLILSWGGVQQEPLTWPVTTKGVQPAYCGNVPTGAENVWWQLISLAGGAKPSHVRVSETLVTVGYSS
jgi:hypothetical protein